MRSGLLHCTLSLLLPFTLAAPGLADGQAPPPAQTAQAAAPDLATLAGPVGGILDPSLIRAGNTWYVFSTGGRPDGPQLPIHCSADLHTWTRCGHVFAQMPDWVRKKLPGVVNLWAPDISFVHGEYRLYYAYSILGRNTSGIALATNKTLDPASPDYSWADRGTVLTSDTPDDFNAIDPNAFHDDATGTDWLVFGSYWTGIKLRQLGPDGLLEPHNHHVSALARRADPPFFATREQAVASQSIEAPFLIHRNGFYYLFTSWGQTSLGPESTYRIVVGRSPTLEGPFLDETGKKLSRGGGTELLASGPHWAGPGGESVFLDPTGRDLIVFHAFDRSAGHIALRVATLSWHDDWPTIDTDR